MRIRKKTYGFDDLLIVPKKTDLVSREHVSLETALSEKYKFQIPLISANMDSITEWEMVVAMNSVGGFGIVHRYMDRESRFYQLEKLKNNTKALSVGITEEEIAIGKDLIDRGVDILCLDVAHGHSTMMERALYALKNYSIRTNKSVHFIAGNVATPEGTEDLIKWGADAVKVGIGPGSMCTTRVVTGAGYGQLSAISDCKAVAGQIPIIADGGIRTSGDAVKALAAGASFLMVGRLLAGCDEVPGWARERGVYRGMASSEAQSSFYKERATNKHAEGVATTVPKQGSVRDILPKFIYAIKSGFSYCGAHNLKELWEKVEFVECTHAVVEESRPHGKRE